MALSPEQRSILHQIVAAPSWKRASPKVRKAVIETVLVESNLTSPDQAHSDRDSEGPFQQRPSQGWGPVSETATQDAEQFLRRAIPLRGQYGSAGELAQAVQRSAYPGRYNQRGGDAVAILRGLGQDVNALVSGGGGGSTARPSGGGGGGRGFTTRDITVTPAVDNTQARRQALAGFLLNSSSQASSSSLPGLDGLPGLGDTTGLPGLPNLTGGGGGTDILGLALQMRALRDQPAVTGTVQVPTGGGGGGSARAASVGGGRGARASAAHGAVKITGPNPDRIVPQVQRFMRQISAVRGGEPVVGSDGSTHSKYTVNGNVSEHYSGHASDIPAVGKRLTNLGHSALIAAGVDPKVAQQAKGGIYNVDAHGRIVPPGAPRKYQIIFNTTQGGNHWNHLHVGVR